VPRISTRAPGTLKNMNTEATKKLLTGPVMGAAFRCVDLALIAQARAAL